jgi:RNA polymerase sigma-70 factor (ECF subfamily)
MTQAATVASFRSSPTTPALRPLRKVSHLELVHSRPARPASSEEELIELMLDNDAAGWARFSREYSGLVLSVIRRVLGRFRSVTSEGDVEEIYARFCFDLLAHDKRKLRLYNPEKGSRLSSWFSLLASNATYDYLRSVRRNQGLDPMPERDCFASECPSAFEVVAKTEQARLASVILDELSERDRQFVELYFGEGLAPEEISAKMGINIKTVYTKKHKITARLSTIVDSTCEA